MKDPAPERSLRAALALLALLAVLIAATASPATAGAASNQFTIFDAAGGLTSVGPAQQAQTLDRLKSLGVDVVRVVVSWRSLAPNPGAAKKPAGFDATNPSSYPQGPMSAVDGIVRGAAARNMLVLLTPSAPVPDWASASGSSAFENPDPGEFKDFVTALGKRYSGNYCPSCGSGGLCVANGVCVGGGGGTPVPRVVFWSIWNEPNISIFLRPQHVNGRPVAGRLYRQLWLAGRSGLKASGHDNDAILMGETSPGPGRGGTPPVQFMRQALCLDSHYHMQSGCDRVDPVGWAQHPYDPYDPPWRTSRGLTTIRSMGRLESALVKAARAGATTRGLPVFVTEYGIESTPDTEFGVSQARQAAYLAIAEYLLYRDPNVLSYSQYLMDDDGGGLKYSFQTGLRFNNDAAKLSYSEFPIPLVAQRTSSGSHRVRLWGEVRPGAGPYKVHLAFRDGSGSPHKLKVVKTDSQGYFSLSAPYRNGRKWRATARAPDGTLLKGPFTPSFVFRG